MLSLYQVHQPEALKITTPSAADNGKEHLGGLNDFNSLGRVDTHFNICVCGNGRVCVSVEFCCRMCLVVCVCGLQRADPAVCCVSLYEGQTVLLTVETLLWPHLPAGGADSPSFHPPIMQNFCCRSPLPLANRFHLVPLLSSVEWGKTNKAPRRLTPAAPLGRCILPIFQRNHFICQKIKGNHLLKILVWPQSKP